MSNTEEGLDAKAAELAIRDAEQTDRSRVLSEKQLKLDDERREVEARREALAAERSKIEDMWALMEQHQQTSAQLVGSLSPLDEEASTNEPSDLADSSSEIDLTDDLDLTTDLDLTNNSDLTDDIDLTDEDTTSADAQTTFRDKGVNDV